MLCKFILVLQKNSLQQLRKLKFILAGIDHVVFFLQLCCDFLLGFCLSQNPSQSFTIQILQEERWLRVLFESIIFKAIFQMCQSSWTAFILMSFTFVAVHGAVQPQSVVVREMHHDICEKLRYLLWSEDKGSSAHLVTRNQNLDKRIDRSWCLHKNQNCIVNIFFVFWYTLSILKI